MSTKSELESMFQEAIDFSNNRWEKGAVTRLLAIQAAVSEALGTPLDAKKKPEAKPKEEEK